MARHLVISNQTKVAIVRGKLSVQLSRARFVTGLMRQPCACRMGSSSKWRIAIAAAYPISRMRFADRFGPSRRSLVAPFPSKLWS